MSDTGKRRRLSRAEIKAYESRRAAERARVIHHEDEMADAPKVVTSAGHTYVLSRDEEYEVVRDDLVRLGVIVAILLVILIGLSFVL